jgi:hypothetical protein
MFNVQSSARHCSRGLGTRTVAQTLNPPYHAVSQNSILRASRNSLNALEKLFLMRRLGLFEEEEFMAFSPRASIESLPSIYQ